jgi:hypothetical protein
MAQRAEGRFIKTSVVPTPLENIGYFGFVLPKLIVKDYFPNNLDHGGRRRIV